MKAKPQSFRHWTRLLSVILTVCLSVSIFSVASFTSAEEAAADKIEADAAWPEDHTDPTDANVYLIHDAADLLAFSNKLAGGTNFDGKTVKLTTNIDLNPGWEAGAMAPANQWADVAQKAFKGTFDGCGYTLSGIYLNSTRIQELGIFGQGAGTACVIKNVNIINSYVTSDKNCTGGILGSVAGTVTISNVYADIVVVSTNTATSGNIGVGGFVGWINNNQTLTIENSVFAGSVSVKSSFSRWGGFVGHIAGNNGGGTATLINCAFYGFLSTNKIYCGGFVGFAQNPAASVSLDSCISAGKIASTTTTKQAGVLMGRIPSSVTGSLSFSNLYYVKSGSLAPVGMDSDTLYKDHVNEVTAQDLTGKLPEGLSSENWTATETMPYPKTVFCNLKEVSRLAVPAVMPVFWGAQSLKQVKDNGKTDIRLIGLVNTLAHEAIGLEISRPDGDSVKVYEIPDVTCVYQSVLAAGETVTAQELGGQYIFVITVQNCPAEGSISFTVRPYTVVNGEKLYGSASTVTCVNGAISDPAGTAEG